MDKRFLDVRPSPLAGRWYPAHPQVLTQNIEEYLAAASPPPFEGEVVGIIAPHAGHRYSGPVAAYAYALLQGKSFELVAILAPQHRPYFAAYVTSAHQAYETPLGIVPIDQKALAELEGQLRASAGESIKRVRQDEEHSLEIHLPFLQKVLGQFRLLPIMIGIDDPKGLQVLGVALAKVLQGHKALIVASTDLSHFYPQSLAEKLDREMLRRMESFDPLYFLRAEVEGKGFACGRSAVATAMWAARELGADQIKVLHYATSGDVTGNYHEVVGYGAAVILRRPQS
ncbi:MAG: AmmeMemoRadiSam system protein B [Anaerolineales bacterium]|nr:AmmeMemoRadiSam system protein B [Anaerolineales bacterium]MDW8446985.1 AmmeMemoRadiSam system protein B [Anaerolineales bacterium]